jgi:hypothetical protein
VLLKRYDPPGDLEDFAKIPGQLDQWSAAVSGWVDGNIKITKGSLAKGDEPQFYNATKTEVPEPSIFQVVGWNALPGTLRNRWGRETGMDLAEQLVPLTERIDGPGSYYVGAEWENRFYRPQDEYCEWHVTRDEQGAIAKVTFTSEPPEYWQAMHGDTLQNAAGVAEYEFTGDKQLMLDLYREYVSPDVQLADLQCHEDFVDYTDPAKPVIVYPKGSYNPYNRWNTTGGIMHLTHPANSLSAEINLGAVATILRTSDSRPVVDPDMLIACAAYGGLNRCSDPTIGSTVNELAALGAWITLRNPVGLAMNHLDLSGFATPSGDPVDASFFTVLRGDGPRGLIERAEFAVPAGEGYTVSDVRIGGTPISRGSQIAEHIVVSIVGQASGLGTFHNTPVPCASSSCQHDGQGNWLTYRETGQGCSPIAVAAFDYPPATPAAGDATLTSAPATQSVPRPTAHRRHRRA